ISADGRFIAYASQATNLVGGPDPNGATENIYLYDADTGTTVRIDSGHGLSPTISADGRYVLFESSAQTYRYDSETGIITLVSADADGATPANQNAKALTIFSLSASGGYGAFEGIPSNLVPGVPDPDQANIFLAGDLRFTGAGDDVHLLDLSAYGIV